MPEWSEHILDALLACGIVEAHELEGIRSRELQEIAHQFVIACVGGQRFDAEQAVNSARQRSERARERQRQAAA